MNQQQPQSPRRFRFDGRKIVSHLGAWLASADGTRCREGSATGQFLENRLKLAFEAGMEAALLLSDSARKKTAT